MPKSKKSKASARFTSRKALISGLAIVLVLGVSAIAYAAYSDDNNNNLPADNNSPENTSESSINYDPPTDQEVNETEKHKQDLSSDKVDTTSPSSGAKNVMPFITSATQTQIRGYISGVFEEGGTCTAVFTKGNTSFQLTAEAFANVNHTTCAPIEVSPGLFSSSGQWSVVLSYSSNTSSGKSEIKLINVN